MYNEPRNLEKDCWFVRPSSSEDFRIVKLEAGGSGNKWRFQHITYCLLHPHDRTLSTHDPETGAPGGLSHQCGNSFPRHYTCVNPYHLFKDPSGENEDRKGCRYGNAFQCPHLPKCVFTDATTGLYRPCVSSETAPPLDCRQHHDGSCFNPGPVVTDDLISYQASDPSYTASGEIPSSQTHFAGQGEAALINEMEDIREEAHRAGEMGLASRRSGH